MSIRPLCFLALVLGGQLICARGEVAAQRIVHAAAEPGNWLTFAGNYQSHRFSSLAEINRTNVVALKPAWIYQTRPGVLETSPIVADGVLYLTEPPSTVTALDAKTGRLLWSWSPNIPRDVIVIGSPPVNRGVAILGNSVFVGTVHGHLVALDAISGAVRWDVVVDDNRNGYYLTLAPLAVGDMIMVGVSGAETGIRGYVDAYDAMTGQRRWRTYTIPSPGEPGSESWAGESWRTGGGSTWLTGSYDPELNLLYWATGNPAPYMNDDKRAGDNLYSCSVLALNPADGRVKWHFQFTPHDVHDWDANEMLVLLDAEVDGRPRKLLTQANRNGFYYVLDRTTGEFLRGTAYVKQTWAKGLDTKGRPMVLPDTGPSTEGRLVFPSVTGAANWHSPSYSPKTHLFYQCARELGAVYYKGDAEYRPGTSFRGGGGRYLYGDDNYGAIRAFEATTGKLKWEFKLQTPGFTSLLSTAGGLVFGGTDEGSLFALNDETGEPLWDLQVGGSVRGFPISFAVEGRQHIAVAAGNALFVFKL